MLSFFPRCWSLSNRWTPPRWSKPLRYGRLPRCFCSTLHQFCGSGLEEDHQGQTCSSGVLPVPPWHNVSPVLARPSAVACTRGNPLRTRFNLTSSGQGAVPPSEHLSSTSQPGWWDQATIPGSCHSSMQQPFHLEVWRCAAVLNTAAPGPHRTLEAWLRRSTAPRP